MVRGVADLKANTGILHCVQDDDAKLVSNLIECKFGRPEVGQPRKTALATC